MNLYQVVFVDGTQASVNGRTLEDAIQIAQKSFGKAVASITLEKDIHDEPTTTFASLHKGGPNF